MNKDASMTLGDILANALKDDAARNVLTEFARIDSLGVSDSLKQKCKEDLLSKFADKIEAVQRVRELSAYGRSAGDRIGIRHAKNIAERL